MKLPSLLEDQYYRETRAIIPTRLGRLSSSDLQGSRADHRIADDEPNQKHNCKTLVNNLDKISYLKYV